MQSKTIRILKQFQGANQTSLLKKKDVSKAFADAGAEVEDLKDEGILSITFDGRACRLEVNHDDMIRPVKSFPVLSVTRALLAKSTPKTPRHSGRG